MIVMMNTIQPAIIPYNCGFFKFITLNILSIDNVSSLDESTNCSNNRKPNDIRKKDLILKNFSTVKKVALSKI
jgi:hypothetical protein